MTQQFTHILIHSDEDGNCVSFLDREELERLLADPIGEYGVEKFLTAEDVIPGTLDPQMWGDNALLVKIEIVKVKPITTAWSIEN